ncbi:hypothetical protein ABG768_008036 [Culter alburnus]|uniref:Uncharacterized protein n=1 Tax=Culter alburnus TaxID=194366 RepID=A0AAW1ZNW2_CULAL
MSFCLCATGCGRSLVPADGHNHCIMCLVVQHTEAAFVDSSCTHCGNMTIPVLRSRLSFLGSQGAGVPSPMPRAAVFSGSGRDDGASACRQGDLRITVRASPPSTTPRAPTPSTVLQPVVLPLDCGGPSMEQPSVSFSVPAEDQMSITASQGEQESSGDEDLAALPTSGTVELPEPDLELTAMLSRAAEKVGLVWNPPPCPSPSWLDDWYLVPMPFFPEVHDEVTKSWRTPSSVRSRPGPSSAFTTLDGGEARGYTRIPPVERSVVMQLCTKASGWRGELRLPKACKFSSGLTEKAYRAYGQAASALHAMALLPMYQAKALMDMPQGGLDQQLLGD